MKINPKHKYFYTILLGIMGVIFGGTVSFHTPHFYQLIFFTIISSIILTILGIGIDKARKNNYLYLILILLVIATIIFNLNIIWNLPSGPGVGGQICYGGAENPITHKCALICASPWYYEKETEKCNKKIAYCKSPFHRFDESTMTCDEFVTHKNITF